MEYGKTINGGIGIGRDGQGGDDILGQNPAQSLGYRAGFRFCHANQLCQNMVQRGGRRDKRAVKGKTIIGQLRHSAYPSFSTLLPGCW